MSYFLYLFISLAVMSTIIYMAQDTISKNEEKYQFEELIKNIELISNTFENVSVSRFSAREVTIYNPDVLEIDCENNLIKGEVKYTQNLKDSFEINEISLERRNDRVYAQKIINNSDINIECNSINFNKGKTKFIFKYQEYDPIDKKIILFIDLVDFDKIEKWASENYKYRQMIFIDHTKILEDLTDFYLFFDSNLSSPRNIKEDGSDIVFVNYLDDSILEREIIEFNKNTGNLKAWVKIPLLSSTTDTRLYVYYGSSTESIDNISWDDYLMIQRLNESPDNNVLGHFDKTSNNIDGTTHGFLFNDYSNTTSLGKTSSADIFSRDVNNYIDLNITDTTRFLSDDNFSVSGWIKRNITDSNTFYENIITKESWGGFSINIYDNNLSVIVDNLECKTTIENNIWNYFIVNKSLEDVRIFINGDLKITCPF